MLQEGWDSHLLFRILWTILIKKPRITVFISPFLAASHRFVLQYFKIKLYRVVFQDIFIQFSRKMYLTKKEHNKNIH